MENFIRDYDLHFGNHIVYVQSVKETHMSKIVVTSSDLATDLSLAEFGISFYGFSSSLIHDEIMGISTEKIDCFLKKVLEFNFKTVGSIHFYFIIVPAFSIDYLGFVLLNIDTIPFISSFNDVIIWMNRGSYLYSFRNSSLNEFDQVFNSFVLKCMKGKG